ncbi:SCP2 sterol-binding domain-containing protein [Pseudomonas luteola]|uniref:SCP2 sterol-binding domain-containing protein n=1 Tax=Pseudomonas luteola TaxID=47886 RepID=UPI00123A87A6|nr:MULTISPECIES: SCP2 sterol-binding domain-containing protein [Pseudomonas]MBA1246752.1 SCP2 sterol-binding domain-containing protein [Pseudomonas zeshuii]QEU28606.1 SCP2 sterol-binding domain-containing protein [Pseudomonas luteola]
MSSADIIENLKSKFNPDAAAGLDLTYQFDIEDGENYHLVVKDQTCDVKAGNADEPDCTLIMNTDTLKGIVSGETDGMQAFMAGKVRAEGNMMLAMKLNELFPN